MGWLEGVLTGYADRHYKIQEDKRRDAELAANREQQVLATLLESKYPDVKHYAGAAMLDLASPRRRSGGVAGWMGEMDKSPYLAMLKRAQDRIAEEPEYAREQLELGRLGPAGPTSPSIPTPAGSVQSQPSLALPATSKVTGGDGTAPTPAPTPPPAPPPMGQPNASFKAGAPAASGMARPNVNFRPGAPRPQTLVPYTGSTAYSLPNQPGKVFAEVDGQLMELTPDARYIVGPAAPDGATAPAPPAPPPAPPGPPQPPLGASPNVSFGPPAPPGAQAAQAEGAAPPQAGPPMAPTGPPLPPFPIASAPPPTPGQVNVGGPGATVNAVGRQPPVRSSRTALPGIFPTAAERQQEQSRAAITGKIDAYTEMYMAQGFSEQEAYRMAADLLERDLIGGSGNPYTSIRGEYTDANGQVIRTPVTFDKAANQYLLPDGSPAPPSLRLVTPGTLGQSVEQAAIEMNYTGGAKTVPPAVMPQVLARAREIEAENILGRPISNTSKAGLVARYQGMWNGVQRPINAMEVNLRTMTDAYRRYKAGDRTAWEPLRTAFVHLTEPNSVVMPSEFARAAGVLSWAQAIWGYIGKAQVGGSPLPDDQIEEMVRLSEAIWAGAATYGSQQRSAIMAAIADPTVNIPPEMVFGAASRYQPDWTGGGAAAPVVTPPPGGGAPVVTPPPGGAGVTPPPGGPVPFVPRPRGFDRDPATGQRYVDGQPYPKVGG